MNQLLNKTPFIHSTKHAETTRGIDVDLIARICHEVNKVFCEYNGDFSQERWDEAAEWQKKAALAGVTAAQQKKRQPEFLHEEWMKEKLADGWTCGAEKDPQKKTHPCLVPFHNLPREQQLKDELFSVIVSAAMEHEQLTGHRNIPSVILSKAKECKIEDFYVEFKNQTAYLKVVLNDDSNGEQFEMFLRNFILDHDIARNVVFSYEEK